uniref:RING-type domain-containing protein n=1 Tax=Neogobius melanostomus TaxID=47308 RepID=A0A8C6WGU4_9GOBI
MTLPLRRVGMASPGNLSEEQVHCSICLDVFTNPVSIPCGHNFCQSCILGYWKTSPLYQCPCARSRSPEMSTNSIPQIVDGLSQVQCDICMEAAIKTKVKTSIEEKLKTYKERDEGIIKELQEEISHLQLKRSKLEELMQSDDALHLLRVSEDFLR